MQHEPVKQRCSLDPWASTSVNARQADKSPLFSHRLLFIEKAWHSYQPDICQISHVQSSQLETKRVGYVLSVARHSTWHVDTTPRKVSVSNKDEPC